MHFPLARIAIVVNVILIGMIAFVNSGTVASIAIDQGERATVALDDTLVLTASVDTTRRADASVTWTSGNEDIATVDRDGQVTLIASGAVAITATSDHDPSKKDTIDITVRAAPIPDSTR